MAAPSTRTRRLRAVETTPAREPVIAVSADALRYALVDAAVDAVVVNDLEGRIIEWNPAATTTFGIERVRRPGADASST